ncbi:hypothetical protein [Demetria terragena]|uniref:hypothetical protein n=1 Tax=Demetria terragena TaxID=63959 RepID=UPI00037FFB71|nr:hypothetical protein [Demetria terragena]
MTNIQNVTGNTVLDRLITTTTSPFAQSAADGAQPLLAAAIWEMPPLSFLGPDGFRAWRGAPVLEQPGVRALDDHSAELVWDMCVRETGTDLLV